MVPTSINFINMSVVYIVKIYTQNHRYNQRISIRTPVITGKAVMLNHAKRLINNRFQK